MAAFKTWFATETRSTIHIKAAKRRDLAAQARRRFARTERVEESPADADETAPASISIGKAELTFRRLDNQPGARRLRPGVRRVCRAIRRLYLVRGE